jgi:DNA segregation ATPase FtsK/SpoIIIE-like protein
MSNHGVKVESKVIGSPGSSDTCFSIINTAKQDLANYVDAQPKGEAVGPTKVQRVLRIGYNRACYMIEEGLKMGVLARCEKSPWLHFIK